MNSHRFSVDEIWRYPVKSMAGEQLDRVEVGLEGFARDREWAVWDIDTEMVASAKRPGRFGGLLSWTAAVDGGSIVR